MMQCGVHNRLHLPSPVGVKATQLFRNQRIRVRLAGGAPFMVTVAFGEGSLLSLTNGYDTTFFKGRREMTT